MLVVLRRAAVAAVLVVVFGAPGSASAQSSFAQLAGLDGCIAQMLPGSEAGGRCADGNGLMQAEAVAVSPDQANVYVAASGTPRSGSNALVTFARDAASGKLTQTGCVSDDGGDGRIGSDGLCTDGDALGGANDVIVSPDGRHVYVSTGSTHGIAWFTRDPDSGSLEQAGCMKAAPRGDNCVWGPALLGANGIAISPDGLHVYVTAALADAVSIYERNADTGLLYPVGCVSDTGSDGACANGTALRGASSVAISPDGAFVYVTAREIGAITSYARDAATGRLEPAGCIVDRAPKGGACRDGTGLAGAASVVLAPEGRHGYVAAQYGGTIAAITRDPTTGDLTQTGCLRHEEPQGDDRVHVPEDDEDHEDEEDWEEEEGADDLAARAAQEPTCSPAKAIGHVNEIAVAPGGRTVFAAGSGELSAFERDPAAGTLRQFGCAQEDPTYRSCSQAYGLYGASGMAASQDGRNLYVASRNAHTVAVFGAAVAITTRAARVRAGTATVRLACPRVRAQGCSGRLRAMPQARGRAYRLKAGGRRTYGVRVPREVRRVTVRATDARRVTRASARRVKLRR